MTVMSNCLETARQKRRELEAFEVKMCATGVESRPPEEADAAIARQTRCDLLTGARLLGLNDREIEELQLSLLFPYMAGELDGVIDASKHPDATRALNVAKKERAFHWEFEFPEVFATEESGGFSAFIGNPPFLGGRNIFAQYGEKYVSALHNFYPSSSGGADLCSYFFLRGFDFLRQKGTLGLIATNTIAQGDTRMAGLEHILKIKGDIYNAVNTYEWPGIAAVYVSIVHIFKGTYSGYKLLDQKPVEFISTLLDSTISLGEPKRLRKDKKVFRIYCFGHGFILETEQALSLIKKDAHNKFCFHLNGII
jgi:hypothetical protein